MSVVIETTLGDITVDLYLDQRPITCLNFLKLCKMKYYNYNLFHTIRSDFIAQTGDPTGEGTGGESIWGILEGPHKRFFSGEKMPKIRHTGAGLLSMVCTDEMMVGSQFFFTLAPDLDSLDGVHCVIGEVTEGQDVLTKLNEVICDETNRPYRDVRITHTVVLEDPFSDPPGLRAPSRSPSPNPERLKGGRIAPDEEIDETQGKSMEEVQEMIEEKEAKARATILEIVGDLPDADIAPPENVLFVCKLNPVTTDDDLEIIFSRFGKIVSCEVIKDKKTGNSLQYAFIEFENKKSCEDAYFKMDNVLIDDRRIHVDFSQSVSKMRYLGKGRGVQYLNDEVITNPEIKKRGDVSRQNYNDRKKYDKEERDDSLRRHNYDKRHFEDEKDKKSKHDDRRQYDRERDEEYRNRRNDRRHNNEKNDQRQYDRVRDDEYRNRRNDRRHNDDENDRSRKHQNGREKDQSTSKRYNDRESEDISRKNHHDQRLDREIKNLEEPLKNSKKERDHRYDKNRRRNESRSRSRSRNRSTERLPKYGESRDKKNIQAGRHDRNHKQSTKKREMSSSPRRDKCERSPIQQKESASRDKIKESKKPSDFVEKNNKISGKEERKKLKQNENKSKDRNEGNKKVKHKNSRTPSPVNDKKKMNRKDKTKSSSKKSFSKRKHKKSTSSDSDSESSSSSSDSSSSSESDREKSKARRRKRKHSSTSSSDSSSSNSSSSDSSSDSSSSSSDSEPRKKRVKKNKNKSSKNSKK